MCNRRFFSRLVYSPALLRVRFVLCLFFIYSIYSFGLGFFFVGSPPQNEERSIHLNVCHLPGIVAATFVFFASLPVILLRRVTLFSFLALFLLAIITVVYFGRYMHISGCPFDIQFVENKHKKKATRDRLSRGSSKPIW